MNKFAFSWAAIALAASAFLSACGGGGGGGDAGSSAEANPSGATAVSGFSAGAGSPAQGAPSQASIDAVFTPDASGLGYPFASKKKAYVAGIKPTSATQAAQDQLIRTQYDYWKTSGVEARCGGYIVKFNDTYATVSEGASYGMLLSVIMAGYDKDARTLFDGLFKVARSKPAYGYNEPALMEWRINADCSSGGGGWNATDGDLDIAMALLMADRQWGSTSGVDYKKEALATIAAIKRRNMNPQGFTGTGPVKVSRTSDYMVGHFKAFKQATGDVFWDLAVTKSFELLNLMQTKFSPGVGLIPDFIINTDTNPIPSPGGNGDGNLLEDDYSYNACRLPWRLATDYVTTGDERSKAVTVKLTDFFNGATGGNPANFSGGYTLSGAPMAPGYANAAFTGPATAGAMVDGKFQPFLNSLWTYSSNNLSRGYYGNELQLISLVVASGNWWNP